MCGICEQKVHKCVYYRVPHTEMCVCMCAVRDVSCKKYLDRIHGVHYAMLQDSRRGSCRHVDCHAGRRQPFVVVMVHVVGYARLLVRKLSRFSAAAPQKCTHTHTRDESPMENRSPRTKIYVLSCTEIYCQRVK